MCVSYLVSLYNKASYIEKTLAAIAKELEVTGGEIVVYDDVSTDNSADLVAQSTLPVRLLRGEVNRGCVFAADMLIQAASHEFTRFVDADDLIVAGSTAKLLEAMKADRYDFVFGNVRSEGSAPATDATVKAVQNPLRRIVRNTGYTPSGMIVRTSSLKAILPLPDDVRHSQDLIMSVRLAVQGRRIGETPLTMAFTPPTFGAGNLSSRMAEMFSEGAGFLAREARHETFLLTDLHFAMKRYARRCSLYFRRTGGYRPSLRERAILQLLALTARLHDRERCCARLRFISELFYRDHAFLVRH